MKPKMRLGRGIDAIFPDQLATAPSGLVQLSVDEIFPNPAQPRKDFDEVTIAELSDSIKKNGVISPIIVRKINTKYEIIAGERRYRAAKKSGLEKIPCIVKEVGDKEAFKISLIENLQRENLNPMDEAEAYNDLVKQFYLTHQDIADSVSKDRTTITNSLRLVALPDKIKGSIREGSISPGHARAILMVETDRDRLLLYEKVMSGRISVRETEKLASQSKTKKVGKRKRKDSEMESLSSSLSDVLSTKVTCSWGNRKGKIIIELYSMDDFNRITEVLHGRTSPI